MTSLHVHRAERHSSGFWTEPPLALLKSRPAKWFSTPGYSAELETSPNGLFGNTEMGCYSGVLRIWHQADKRLVGVGEFQLLTSPGGQFSDEDYERTLGIACDFDPMDFAGPCKVAFGSLAAVFEVGRSVVCFHRLELLPDSGLKGLGVEVGRNLMRHLSRYYGAAAFIVEPFPLQYLDRSCSSLEPGEVADEAGFGAAKTKLWQLYEREWGAYPVNELYMVLSQRYLLAENDDDPECDLGLGMFSLFDPRTEW